MPYEPLVSVVIPVYNVNKYLEECLKSVLGQTYTNTQIILVDDGSSDGSGEICDSYAKTDSRIVSKHQENRGVSAARNSALEEASGEFVVFVDSDDVVPPDSIQKRVESIGDSDLLACRVSRMFDDGTFKDERRFTVSSIEKRDYMMELFLEKKFGYQGFLVDKLFRNDIIKGKGITFDTDVKLNEDRLFLLEYIQSCEDIKLYDGIVYYYRQRPDGAIGETKRGVTAGELTVTDSFEKMKALTKGSFEELYYLICKRAFECGFTLYRRSEPDKQEQRKGLKQIMWSNAAEYMKKPGLSFWEKAKVIGHCILKK